MTASNPDRLDRIESTLETVLETIQKLDADLRSTNEQVKKWDGRLWGLTLALISTAWVGIIGSTAVVITRSLAGG